MIFHKNIPIAEWKCLIRHSQERNQAAVDADVRHRFFLHIFSQNCKKEWNRVLFVPTGALLNKTSYNEGQPILGIAHAIVLESSAFFS